MGVGGRTRSRYWRLATGLIAAVVTSSLVFQFRGPGALATPGHPRAHTWYVDCRAEAGGNGSIFRPFNTLQAASSVTLGPGDQLLFHRGTTCAGMLAPQGGGADGDPVVIGAYGGAFPDRLPRIDAGGTASAAVLLADMSNVTVQDLELTNAGNSTGEHRGLYFTSSDRQVRGVTVRRLVVHDVDGTAEFSDAAKTGGAIIGQALSSTGRFSNVVIEDNRIRDVSRQGIWVVGTTSSSRPPATSPWPQASTGVVIRGNVVERVQGDGIAPLGTVDALVEHNVVRYGNLGGFDFESPSRRCAAGIWSWNANGTVIQYNEVSNMHYGPSATPGALNGCDGDGFDADFNQDGTIIQYNYSHDNEGGFILFCMSAGQEHRADVRYNLSIDDNGTFSYGPCAGGLNPATNNLSGLRMYNNTIVAATPRVTVDLNESLAQVLAGFFGDFAFENNIIYATSPDAAKHVFVCGTPCTNNVFSNMPPPATATNSVTSDPLFVNARRHGDRLAVALGFRLRQRSPAIDAGVVIPLGVPNPVTHDFFGVPIPNPPTIGFAQQAREPGRVA
jgi:hypothetical protein